MSSVSLCSLSGPQLSASRPTMSCSDLPIGVHFVTPKSLEQYLLIVDIRPYNQFHLSHIVGAVNLCIPTTLLRRLSYPLATILQDLPSSLRDSLLSENSDSNTKQSILLYDSDSRQGKVLPQLSQTISKFANVNANMEVWDGGFHEVPALIIDSDRASGYSPQSQTSSTFASPTGSLTLSSVTTPGSATSNFSLAVSKGFHPENVAATPVYAAPKNGFQPESRPVRKTPTLSQPSYLGGFTLPAATPSKQKFLTSLKTNLLPKLDMESIHNDKKSFHKLHVPSSLNSSQLPPWLRFVLEMPLEEILELLASKFSKIERLQQIRLASAISNSSTGLSPPAAPHTLCSPIGLCPQCDSIDYKLPQGIEDSMKNRYHNVWPYEHSRVKLQNRADDYFNANYILDKYIATQNPLANTYADFWQLVWENNVRCIVSLNGNSSNQSDILFPRNGHTGSENSPTEYFEDQKLGGFEIRRISKTSYDDFTLMELHLSQPESSQPSRKVYRLEFEQWPDFGVPTDFSSFIEFIEFKNSLLTKEVVGDSTTPLLVHCSAGCGRTGVFITLDLLISRYNVGEDVILHSSEDQVYKVIQHQRTQRVNMVQNVDQYFVCYELMLHYIGMRTA